VASGRSTKLTGQAGEFLVAAELARRGFISTTFTGNVPHYDIIASNERGKHVLIQVKTIRGPSWQFDISTFCPVEQKGGRQILGRAKRAPIPGLICVLLILRRYGTDRFFLCSWKQLRDLLVADYRKVLDRHGGRRPRNPKSLHTALWPKSVERFENNWSLLDEKLR
jgi:hypothetical protein